jgi:hypothetical protein
MRVFLLTRAVFLWHAKESPGWWSIMTASPLCCSHGPLSCLSQRLSIPRTMSVSNIEQPRPPLQTYLFFLVHRWCVWSKSMLRIGYEECPHCRRDNIYISRPKSLGEELAILLLLRPVRCHDCMHRFLNPLFVATPLPYGTAVSRRPVQQASASEKVERRSA